MEKLSNNVVHSSSFILPISLKMASPFNPVGVVGAGSFGTAIANLLAYNTDVLLSAASRK